MRILLLAAIVSFILAIFGGDHDEGITAYVEPFVILTILIANATIGVWQESNAENALEALKSMQPDYAKVIRNGQIETILSVELVPGDVVQVSQGDKIPADVRILKLNTSTLKINQAMLTGENEEVMKYPCAID